MGVPSKQIGWSQEAILLHAVSKQLERLQGIIASSSGGGGGSQNLQQTLDNGNTADEYSSIELTGVSTEEDNDQGFISPYLFQISRQNSLNPLRTSIASLIAGEDEYIPSVAGLTYSRLSLGGGGVAPSDIRSNPYSAQGRIFLMPEVLTDSLDPVALATTEDITLQKALNGGHTANYANGTQLSLMLDNGEGAVENMSYIFSGVGSQGTQVYQGSSDIKLIKVIEGGNSKTFDLGEVIENNIFKLPSDKLEGEYILSTRDDITLQKALDNNGYAESTDGNNSIELALNGEFPRVRSVFDSDSGGGEFIVSTDISRLRNSNVESNASATFDINLGILSLVQENSESVLGSSTVKFITPISGVVANYLIPSKAISGDYTLSIAKTYTDATTVTKSSATLTTDYPLAAAGDKVQALSIIAGARIYEKTSTGWVEYTVTPVV